MINVKIISSFTKNIYIRWKGNPNNPHEKHNRVMNLINAIPLFKLNSINFAVITKTITKQEKKILKRYKIPYCLKYGR